MLTSDIVSDATTWHCHTVITSSGLRSSLSVRERSTTWARLKNQPANRRTL